MTRLARRTMAAGLVIAALVVTTVMWKGGDDHNLSAAKAAHPHDASMMSEHCSLLNLVPDSDYASHVAAKDGPWSSKDTWAGDKVPATGAIVHIPPAINVTYQGDPQHHYFLVRVDGSLSIGAPDGMRTAMIVDTLFSTPDSTITIEAANATAGSIEIELRPFDIEAYKNQGAPAWGSTAKGYYSDGAVVTDVGAGTLKKGQHKKLDDGPGVLGRYGWDPQQLSIGLITHGEISISGQPKQGRAKITRTARKGDTSVVLDGAPTSWAVGDQVVVTGTHYVGRDSVTGGCLGTEDEIRNITSVEGNQIGLDRPLVFDHDTPRPNLNAYAANLTRNILIRSGEDVPLDLINAETASANWSSLAHVMFMHNENVTVRYATFDDLGRSNKNDTLDDIRRKFYDGINADRTVRSIGDPLPPDKVTNRRGRYSVHLHRTGPTADDGVAVVEGSVVTGGPGWGYVCHDSRADFTDNVAYGVLGAAFVAETGNETGTWDGNIAINTYGADFNSLLLGPKGVYRYENEDYHLTILLEKRGAWKNHDFGHFGNGYWLQGKQIDVQNNVSVNSGMQGYFYMFRAPDQINVLAEVIREPAAIHRPGGMHPFAPGLRIFKNNESIADRGGLAMIGLSGGRANNERSEISNFTAWEVGQVGTHCQYYPGYLIKDSTFLASKSPGANPTEGIHFLKVTMDIVLANLTVEGFPTRYFLKKGWSPGARNQAGFIDPYEIIAEAKDKGEPNPLPFGHAHILIDPGFTRQDAARPENMGTTYREEDLILTSADLQIGRFEVDLDDSSLKINLDYKDIEYGKLMPDPIRPTLHEGHVLLLRGTKTDSVGSIPIAYHNNVLVWHEDAVQHRLETGGYYHMPNGKIGVILEEVLSDRYTADNKVVRFVAELDPRWDLAKAIDRGEFVAADHPGVYVPQFLLGE